MKKILAILIALSACGDDIAYAPDAALQVADAAIDARPDAPVNRGCMGNLPDSRTTTINTGDPIPPNLINELQDMHAADRRKPFTRGYFPTCWVALTGGTAALVDDPITATGQVWKLTTGHTYEARMFYESGDLFESLTLDVLGDGAVDWIGNLLSDSTAGGGLTIASNGSGRIDQPGGAWALESTFTLVPHSLPDKGFLNLELAPTGGTFLWIRGVYVTFRR